LLSLSRPGRLNGVRATLRRVPLACQCFMIEPLLFPAPIVPDDGFDSGIMDGGSGVSAGVVRSSFAAAR
ncbi:MAG: hypothetical protein WED34_03540, partial [Planctomycetales bacterium]